MRPGGAEPRPVAGASRRTDFDTLRLLAVLFLFVFHTAKVFDADPLYHVKSPTPLATASAITWWIRRWQMPLLFLISGWATAVALRRTGRTAFVRRRLARLGAPLVVGVVVLCPPIKWIELARGWTLRPSGPRAVEPVRVAPLELLEAFFTRLDHFTWSHLWFLVYLLVFTLVALPLIGGRRSAANGGGRTRGSVLPALLPLLVLVPLEAALRPRFGDYPNLYDDWANLALFSTYFALGIALARWPAFEAALRHGRALHATLLIVATILAAVVGDPHLRSGLGAAVGWSAVAWAIGVAPGLRWPTPLVHPRLLRSSLAIYVLHHTPLLVIAHAATRSTLPRSLQALVIPVGAMAATALLVFLAWRWSPSRRLFGLAPADVRPTS